MRPLTIGYAVFLKNREIRASIVKKSKKDGETTETPLEEVFNEDTVKLAEEAAKRIVKYTAATVVGAIVVVKVVSTLSEIAVKKTKSADNEK